MSTTETPLVTPDEMNKILTRENADLRAREKVAKEANDAMRAELEKADALRNQLATAEATVAHQQAEWDALLKRNEAAEARVRELGEKYDEWVRLYAEQGARLAAVLGAADAMRAERDYIIGALASGRMNAACDAYDAAKAGAGVDVAALLKDKAMLDRLLDPNEKAAGIVDDNTEEWLYSRDAVRAALEGGKRPEHRSDQFRGTKNQPR